MHNDSIVLGQKVDRAKVMRAKELRREMTEDEKLLWRELCTNRLQGLHFRRQQVISGFIVDFYCHSARLVVEVDGGIHQEQAEYDAERDRLLHALGLRILRLTNDEVRSDMPGVLARILVQTEQSSTPASP